RPRGNDRAPQLRALVGLSRQARSLCRGRRRAGAPERRPGERARRRAAAAAPLPAHVRAPARVPRRRPRRAAVRARGGSGPAQVRGAVGEPEARGGVPWGAGGRRGPGPMTRICFFGAYDPGYPRNRMLREGLTRAGDVVLEARVAERRAFRRYPALVA